MPLSLIAHSGPLWLYLFSITSHPLIALFLLLSLKPLIRVILFLLLRSRRLLLRLLGDLVYGTDDQVSFGSFVLF
jgi:hypothetical protein